VAKVNASARRGDRPDWGDEIDKGRGCDYNRSHMKRRIPFTIIFAPITRDHLRAIAPKHYTLIRDAIALQLSYEPEVETRNRQPLKRPGIFGARWKIRFGPDNRFRVLYKVNQEAHQVEILAIGEKDGERLFIGGEEVES
jgi:mRNA-degrading endonuclease RelE of RelBE toxin-antitoxin system